MEKNVPKRDDFAGVEMVRQGLALLGVKPEKMAERILNITDSIREDDTLVPIPAANLMRKGVKRRRATIGLIDNGKPLFPAKTLNMVFGSDNAGKSWLMMAILVQEMKAGNNVMWIDYEASDAEEFIERLLLLGVSAELIDEHLTAFVPNEGLRPTHHDQWFNLIREKKVTLVVIDSYGEMLARAGLDENRDSDVANINT